MSQQHKGLVDVLPPAMLFVATAGIVLWPGDDALSWIVTALGTLAAGWAMAQWARPWRLATIWLAALAAIGWLQLTGGSVLISPDTAAYLTWSPGVPLGYPLLLAAVEAVTGSLVAITAVQVLMLAGGTLALALAVARLTGRDWIGLLALFAILSCGLLFAHAGFLLSEAPYAAVLLLDVAFALLAIHGGGRGALLGIGLSAAALMFLRPAGYFAPLGVVFLLLARVAAVRRVLLWAVLPMLLGVAASVAVNQAVRGTTTSSQVGRVLLAHVSLMVDGAGLDAADAAYGAAVADAMAPYRLEFAARQGVGERYAYVAGTYNERLGTVEAALRPLLPDGSFATMEAVELRLFLATVAAHWPQYLGFALEHDLGAWEQAIAGWRQPAAEFLRGEMGDLGRSFALLTAYRLPLSQRDVTGDPNRIAGFPLRFTVAMDEVYHLFWIDRPLILFAGLATLFAIPIALVRGRRSPRWLLLGYLGVIIHGASLLAAFTTAFIPRYALPIDPFVLLAATLIVAWAAEWVALRVRRGPREFSDRQ